MNAPSAALVVGVALLFADAPSLHLDPVRPGQGAAGAPRQPPHPPGDLRPRARPDPRRRHAGRPLRAQQRRAEVAAHLPQGELYSHVTGYYSFIYGPGGGLESAENALLSGQSDKLFYRRVSDMLTGTSRPGPAWS